MAGNVVRVVHQVRETNRLFPKTARWNTVVPPDFCCHMRSSPGKHYRGVFPMILMAVFLAPTVPSDPNS